MERFDKIIEFEKRLAKTDGFDIEKVMRYKPDDYLITAFNKGNYPTYIFLYAKIGIHKYNLQKGTNLKLHSIKKYHRRPNCVEIAFYITAVAKDKDGASLVPFQIRVIEQVWQTKLYCDIARLKLAGPQDDQPLTQESVDDDDGDQYPRDVELPEWPSDDSFNDESRYYVVNQSDREKHDWIRMYMQLAFLKANINANLAIKEPELSKLSFAKVAVESPKKVELPEDRLKAANATFYIKCRYHQPENVEMPLQYAIAVIRRTVDKDNGAFSLMFDARLVGKEEAIHGS